MSGCTHSDDITVRPETPSDHKAIHRLVEVAFDSPLEARLVDRLRADGDLVLSLLAEVRGRIVGYVGFSRLRIARLGIDGLDERAVALSPLAVTRCFRRQGIAERLIRDGLDRLTETGEDLVFVLGDPAYYARFGFAADTARQYYAQWAGPAFMALELDHAGRVDMRPKVIYPPAFEAFG